MIFKELSPQDFRVVPSVGEQTVEISQQDIANSANRRRYMTYYAATDVDPNDQPNDPVKAELVGTTRQVVTGTYQTVYDMDHTNQHANPLMDMSFGIYGGYEEGVGWSTSELAFYSNGHDERGKALWKNFALQTNEKMDSYRQYAARLLGDPSAAFVRASPSDPSTIEEIGFALFVNFRRSMFRDGIQRGSVALRMYREVDTRMGGQSPGSTFFAVDPNMKYWTNSYRQSIEGEPVSVGELVIVDRPTSDPRIGTLNVARYTPFPSRPDPYVSEEQVGVVYYLDGVAVLDVKRVANNAQPMMGVVSTLEDNGMKARYDNPSPSSLPGQGWNILDPLEVDFLAISDPFGAAVLPVSRRLFVGLGLFTAFLIQASIDDILDHIASTRFISDPDSDLTAITFKSKVRTQSMIIHCRVAPEDFNYSNNPTYTDEDGNIVARDSDTKPFSYVTKIVLLDASNRILATAALSRPLFNDSETDQSFRIRLDY